MTPVQLPFDSGGEVDRLLLEHFAPPAVVVTEELRIVQFRGSTGPYMEFGPGVPSLDLLRLARKELRPGLQQAVAEARQQRARVRRSGLPLGDEPQRLVDVEVLPLKDPSGEPLFLIVFQDSRASDVLLGDAAPPSSVPDASVPGERIIRDQLRRELHSTRQYLQGVIADNEWLQLTTEEVHAKSEELLQINASLHIAREDLLVINRALRDLNEELARRELDTNPGSAAPGVSPGEVLVDALQMATERLARTQRVAESLADAVGTGLLMVDSGGQICGVNRAFCQAFGLDRERLLYTALASLPRGPWKQPAFVRLVDALERGETSSCDVADESSGETRRFHISGRRLQRQDGMLGLAFEDVTERARAEDALRRREAELEEVLAAAVVGILTVDESGRIVFANRSVARLFGYEERMLVGESIELLVPEAGRVRHAAHRAEYADAPRRRRMAPGRAFVGRHRDGTEIAADILLSPVTTSAGRLVVCFVTDMTARLASERQIRDYQEKLRQMAFDAALTEERERRRIAADLHDQIGQALAVAQLKLEALRDGNAEPTALDDAIELLAGSSADVRTLLFDLSPPILYDLGLGPAISWLAEDFGKRWGLAIEVHAEDDGRPLDELTATVAFRAVRELLTNVLKHAEAARARVLLRRGDERLSISVEDQGVGFELEPPSQLSEARGFGLFSVREQISRLGGTLTIETSPGHGTQVRLQLPLMGPRLPAPGERAFTSASTSATEARQTGDEGP